jgi:hypothetical protein
MPLEGGEMKPPRILTDKWKANYENIIPNVNRSYVLLLYADV